MRKIDLYDQHLAKILIIALLISMTTAYYSLNAIDQTFTIIFNGINAWKTGSFDYIDHPGFTPSLLHGILPTLLGEEFVFSSYENWTTTRKLNQLLHNIFLLSILIIIQKRRAILDLNLFFFALILFLPHLIQIRTEPYSVLLAILALVEIEKKNTIKTLLTAHLLIMLAMLSKVQIAPIILFILLISYLRTLHPHTPLCLDYLKATIKKQLILLVAMFSFSYILFDRVNQPLTVIFWALYLFFFIISTGQKNTSKSIFQVMISFTLAYIIITSVSKILFIDNSFLWAINTPFKVSTFLNDSRQFNVSWYTGAIITLTTMFIILVPKIRLDKFFITDLAQRLLLILMVSIVCYSFSYRWFAAHYMIYLLPFVILAHPANYKTRFNTWIFSAIFFMLGTIEMRHKPNDFHVPLESANCKSTGYITDFHKSYKFGYKKICRVENLN